MAAANSQTLDRGSRRSSISIYRFHRRHVYRHGGSIRAHATRQDYP
jgi:hypothetical protein